MSGGLEQAVVLVLRAWSESAGDLRVRITTAAVWGEGEERAYVVSGVDAAVEVVRSLLEELAAP